MSKKKFIWFMILILVIGYIIGQLPILGNSTHHLKEEDDGLRNGVASQFVRLSIPMTKIVEWENAELRIDFLDVNFSRGLVKSCLNKLNSRFLRYPQPIFSSANKLFDWFGLSPKEVDFVKNFLMYYEVMLDSMFDENFLDDEDKVAQVQKIEKDLWEDIYVGNKYREAITEEEWKKAKARDTVSWLECRHMVKLMMEHETLMEDLKNYKDTFYSEIYISISSESEYFKSKKISTNGDS